MFQRFPKFAMFHPGPGNHFTNLHDQYSQNIFFCLFASKTTWKLQNSQNVNSVQYMAILWPMLPQPDNELEYT